MPQSHYENNKLDKIEYYNYLVSSFIFKICKQTIMAETIAIGVVPFVLGFGGIISSSSRDSKDDDVFFLQSWDPFSDYYKFERQYNDIIDKLLMDPLHGCMGDKSPISERAFMPGPGKHSYFKQISTNFMTQLFNEDKVNFYKKSKTHNGTEIITYYCQVSPIAKMFVHNSFEDVLRKIYRSENNLVRVTSINTAAPEPRLYIKNQIYKTPTAMQSMIATAMIDKYFDPTSNNNVKLFITGERGSQKTYMGKVIKQMLDNCPLSNGQICVTLVDNFNPKDIGVNIETIILSKASYNNPIVIVINEFDNIMDYVVDPMKQNFDPRLQHARDKSNFNNMLDNIADTQYCITIFTGETSVDELARRHEDFKSFMRKGRMDYYVRMSKDAYDITEVI